MPYTLPKLPYAYDALEPSISKQIMELHHSKHHQTYITNLNKALETSATALSQGNLADHAAQLSAIRFNGGGHINHSLFWQNLCPASSADAKPETAAPTLHAAIASTWGSLDKFKAAFTAELLGIQGSGWGWLVKEKGTGLLRIVTLANQEAVVVGDTPILGVDMWEHAYYLQYLNGKAAYVENIWKIINWKTCEARFVGGRDDAFVALKANM
ncbi:cytoplasmic manganese antioxidant oxidoreductase [Pseudomassariella vexata]|uniref:Superoxide dismutase n=1 Tax=Pseudomassariella vexata TaxID=1141098 RepID=A0A1Y2DR38_9PEZI|nr:cytoplasmic manganese antioxidant oxidoreductase [Pseudomassariella vexata]ORY61649.1 cytoplasmic manganese antioxidant oxidoreductase [Pseudomassariella vexata]